MYLFLFKDARPLSPADGEDRSGATWASETDLSTKVPLGCMGWAHGAGGPGQRAGAAGDRGRSPPARRCLAVPGARRGGCSQEPGA